MRYILFTLFLFISYSIYAMPITHIMTDSSRSSADIIRKHFDLKVGDEFSKQNYEQAKQNLEKTRLFRDLKFIYKEKQDGVDIHIKADDRSYVVPMFFGLSGNKHAFGASAETHNLFQKNEEIAFFMGGGRDGFDTHGSFA